MPCRDACSELSPQEIKFREQSKHVNDLKNIVYYLEELLCSACKLLSYKQIKSVKSNVCPSEDLLFWYQNHLADDLERAAKGGDDIKKVSLIVDELKRVVA